MLVVRTDITRKLRSAKLLLINLSVFGEKNENTDYGTIWDYETGALPEELKSSGVDLLGFRSGSRVPLKTAKSLKIRNISVKADKKKDLLKQLEGNYSFKDIVLLGAELSDIEIARLSSFSIATASSPLELKMESDFVSNFSGIDVFQEIGNLILNAKGPYRQYKTKSV